MSIDRNNISLTVTVEEFKFKSDRLNFKIKIISIDIYKIIIIKLLFKELDLFVCLLKVDIGLSLN